MITCPNCDSPFVAQHLFLEDDEFQCSDCDLVWEEATTADGFIIAVLLVIALAVIVGCAVNGGVGA